MTWPSHGSNPHYLYQSAGITMPKKIIDFSSNINPLGPPSSLKENWSSLFETIDSYPDPKTATLKACIAKHEGIEENQLLIGNGAAELISLVGRLLTGKNVLIIQPAFSEYEEACNINDCTVYYFQLEHDWGINIETFSNTLKRQQIEAVFLCNPTNPTGVYYSSKVVETLLQECEKHDCLLIVDEAFYDFVEEYESLIPLLRNSSLILLRSLTKLFAIPSLRLGFVISNSSVIKELAKYQPHWSVNGIALQAGELCLQDESFTERTIQYISDEREKMFRFFEEWEFQYSDSRVNFYLLKDARIQDQYPLFLYLLQEGIVPRHTFNFPGLKGSWLRFAVKSKEDNEKLREGLGKWRSTHP